VVIAEIKYEFYTKQLLELLYFTLIFGIEVHLVELKLITSQLNIKYQAILKMQCHLKKK
jgi:hypothetical protein